MDITAYIRELLFSHDCVILPGFGGFIGNYTTARIDQQTNTFFPPVKQISFNRNLNNNDGLLIGRISASAKMNYTDVRNLVDQFTEEIRKKLSKGEKVVFEKIGSFVNNHEGNVQFEPDRDSNYHLDSYGLTSFQVIPIEGYDVRKKVLKYKDKAPVTQTSMRKILWRAAVIIPLLAALVIVPLTTDIFKTNVQRTSLNPLANVEFENNRQAVDKIRSTDSTEKSGISVDHAKAPAVEITAPLVEEKVLRSEEPEEVYCLIAGSFQSEINAANLIKKLEGAGYKPELLKGPNGFWRVSAARCTNITEAVRIRDSIDATIPGSWVTRIK